MILMLKLLQSNNAFGNKWKLWIRLVIYGLQEPILSIVDNVAITGTYNDMRNSIVHHFHQIYKVL